MVIPIIPPFRSISRSIKKYIILFEPGIIIKENQHIILKKRYTDIIKFRIYILP